MVFQRSIVNSSGGKASSVYEHSDIHLWCNVIQSIGVICILSICAFCYMCKLFGVQVFHIPVVSGGR